ncbi:hypothetical protein RJ639_028019 [Escallonia herrerae]|uniref:Amidase domain-containing protein n=1 Tax=Escallonia herrerae TaxID=1293975 RepID=A0AA88X2A7_9ASTE|nr:hypothetical protein RJ639_028019 [Escallonia herrerae]
MVGSRNSAHNAIFKLREFSPVLQLVSFADLEESPMYVPLHPSEDLKEQEVKCVDAKLSPPEQVQHAVDCLQPPEEIHKSSKYSFRRWTILDYSRAYMSREVTPRVHLATADNKNQGYNSSVDIFIVLFCLSLGEPISALDGILIAIKDEIDCMPYPTTGGTKWLHKARPCIDDACCVKRLRLCGAILVGKTNMHELGAGTSGINPHYGVARNPYNTSKISGGSSSGSASVVSAGLCPVALGVDGGGSVRMPAALCGVVGLKPSFGRVPHSGVLPLNWTVGMVGILAGTVEDALIAYAAISGHVPAHQFSTTSWFNDCTDDIRVCCSNALEHLYEHYKWETIGVTLPEIEVMRLAHYLTIGSECSSSIACHLEKLDMAEVGWDVRVALAVYGAFNSRDYLNAQRIR